MPPVSETAAPAQESLSPSVSLNTFLDLNGAGTFPEARAVVQQTDTKAEAALASPPLASASGVAEIEGLAGKQDAGNQEMRWDRDRATDSMPNVQAMEIQAPVSWESAPEMAGVSAAENRGWGSWTNRLMSLLVVVSLPLAWSFSPRRRNQPAPSLGETAGRPPA
jgi:hypothetical protein